MRDAPQAEAAITASGLTKAFDGRPALREVSFTAQRGELLAVIGPNGAGKTTLLSILAGIRRADSGTVSNAGGQIGWVPQQAALYRRLTVAENLRLFAKLEKLDDPDAAVERMLDQVDLQDRRDDQVGTLSGGNQQRVNVAIGLLSHPSVLLLDEPSSGLDPGQRARLWEFVLDLARSHGTTVVFSTHYLQEAERYGDRLLVIAEGETVFDGTPAQLHEAVPEQRARDFEEALVLYLREHGH